MFRKDAPVGLDIENRFSDPEQHKILKGKLLFGERQESIITAKVVKYPSVDSSSEVVEAFCENLDETQPKEDWVMILGETNPIEEVDIIDAIRIYLKLPLCKGVIRSVGGVLSHGSRLTKEMLTQDLKGYSGKFIVVGCDGAENLRDGQEVEIKIQGDTATIS